MSHWRDQFTAAARQHESQDDYFYTRQFKTYQEEEPTETGEDMNLQEKLDELCREHGYKTGLAGFAQFHTSRLINFATDSWGCEEGKTHFEIKWGDRTLMLDVDPEKISINTFGRYEQTAMNALEIHAQ